ncbi:hypothetical protein BDF19DRAFT_444011, partial [Syncephalis fuscata]
MLMEDTPPPPSTTTTASTSSHISSITTSRYGSWCRPPPPPPTPTLSLMSPNLSMTSSATNTATLITSMLAEASAHGTTAADVLATAVAAAMAASIVPSDQNELDVNMDKEDTPFNTESDEPASITSAHNALLASLADLIDDNTAMSDALTQPSEEEVEVEEVEDDEDEEQNTSTSTSKLITEKTSVISKYQDDKKIIHRKLAPTPASTITRPDLIHRLVQPRLTGSILSSLPNSPSFRPLSSITVKSKQQSFNSQLHGNTQQSSSSSSSSSSPSFSLTSSASIHSTGLFSSADELRKRRTAEVNGAFAKQAMEIKRPRLFKAKPPVLVPVVPRNITTARNFLTSTRKNVPIMSRSVTLPLSKEQSDNDTNIDSSGSEDDGTSTIDVLDDSSIATKGWRTPASVCTETSLSSKTESIVSSDSNADKEIIVDTNMSNTSNIDLLSIDELLDTSRLYGRHTSLDLNDGEIDEACTSLFDTSEGGDTTDKQHLNALARWKRVPIGVFRRTRRRRNSLPEMMCASAVKWHHAANYTLTTGQMGSTMEQQQQQQQQHGHQHNTISANNSASLWNTSFLLAEPSSQSMS